MPSGGIEPVLVYPVRVILTAVPEGTTYWFEPLAGKYTDPLFVADWNFTNV